MWGRRPLGVVARVLKSTVLVALRQTIVAEAARRAILSSGRAHQVKARIEPEGAVDVPRHQADGAGRLHSLAPQYFETSA